MDYRTDGVKKRKAVQNTNVRKKPNIAEDVLSDACDNQLLFMKQSITQAAAKLTNNVESTLCVSLLHMRANQLDNTEELLSSPKFTELSEFTLRSKLQLLSQAHTTETLSNDAFKRFSEQLKSSGKGKLDLWNSLGVCLATSGRLHSADELYRGLLEYHPTYLDAAVNRMSIATCLCSEKHTVNSGTQSLLAQDTRHVDALNTFAVFLLASGKYSQAIHILERILEIDASFTGARVNLALAHFALGQRVESSNILSQVLSVHESTHVALNQLYVSLHHNQIATACEQLKRIGTNGSAETLIACSKVQRSHEKVMIEGESKILDDCIVGSGEDNKELLCKALQSHKGPFVWFQMGITALAEHKYGEANEYFAACIQHAVGHEAMLAHPHLIAATLNNLGVSYLLHKSKDTSISSAEAALQKALAINENTTLPSTSVSHAYNNLGTLYRERKQYESAWLAYNRSLEFNSSNAATLNNIGLLCIAEQKWDEAKKYFASALCAHPKLECARINLHHLEQLYN